MTLKDRLKELIQELDRLHPGGAIDPKAWNVIAGDGIPNFSTSASGDQRHFSKLALAALSDLVHIKYENDSDASSKMEVAQFGTVVRQCVVDLHAAGLLDVHDADLASQRLNDEVRFKLSQLQLGFTHYFTAWTLGMDSEQPFVLGPVTFLSVHHWIDSVEFPVPFLQTFFNTPEENARWKDSLRQMLDEPDAVGSPKAPISLARIMRRAIGDCRTLLKVTIDGYELRLSRKVGELVCKSTLDAISLLFGGRSYFYQQALAHEHLPPMRISSISEMNGQLLLPGDTHSPRLRTVSYPSVRDYLAENMLLQEAFSHILSALVDPTATSHPNLAKRWATALDWYSSGQRERNDAVALAKIATSLDVLSRGGRLKGILTMLTNLLGKDENAVIVKGRSPLTLKQFTRRIYEDGRSQILHGTEFDRIKSFEVVRDHAAVLARLALLEAALRLETYSGADKDDAFVSMQRSN